MGGRPPCAANCLSSWLAALCTLAEAAPLPPTALTVHPQQHTHLLDTCAEDELSDLERERDRRLYGRAEVRPALPPGTWANQQLCSRQQCPTSGSAAEE